MRVDPHTSGFEARAAGEPTGHQINILKSDWLVESVGDLLR